MVNTTSFKTDMKMIIRNPILILFLILPIFIPIVFKWGISPLTQWIAVHFEWDLTRYYGYILSFSILMAPYMLGTVVGFLMIDERDSRIQELIKITPLGYTGYIFNRLMLPFIGSIAYTFATYLILRIYNVSMPVLLLISILGGIQGILVGYLLYILAEDKVQGLTYSKGFGIFNIFAIADIINIRWFSIVAGFTPFFWTTRLIVNFSMQTVLVAIIIHGLYMFIIVKSSKI